MSFKTVVVLLDRSSAAMARARYAVELCRRYDAHLVGVFVVPSGWNGNPADSYIRGHAAIKALIERRNAEETAASNDADREFSAVMERRDVSFEFRITREEDVDHDLHLHSLYADLVIAGCQQSGALPTLLWTAQALLLSTGVPLLVFPEGWRNGRVGERVLLGWNASREARRAIMDALPLLTAAQSVSVVIVDPAANPRLGEDPGADIALVLSRQGANVTVDKLDSKGVPIASVILEFAWVNDVDLVVVGAYSHSRTREVLFGGVTRSLLEHTTVPMLVAH